MQVGKLTLQQVKAEIEKLKPKEITKTLTKEEKRTLNALGRKKNQLEKTLNKEKRKGDPHKRNFHAEWEISEGTKAIVRNFLNEDLEIKKLEAELNKRKEQIQEFGKMYHEVLGKFDKISEGIIEDKNVFERRMGKLKEKVPEEDDEKMKELEEIKKEGMKRFELIQTIGQQNIKKYSLKRKIGNFERSLKKKRKEDEESQDEMEGVEEEEVMASGSPILKDN